MSDMLKTMMIAGRRVFLVTLLGLVFVGLYASDSAVFKAGFDGDTAGWNGVDGNYWRIVPSGRSGSALQRVFYKGTEAKAEPYSVISSEWTPVQAGTDYLLEGFVRFAGERGAVAAALRVTFQNDKKQTVEEVTTERIYPYSTFNRIAELVRVPEGAASARVELLAYVERPVDQNSYLTFDDVRFGPFDVILDEMKVHYHREEPTAPLRLESEDAGSVTRGSLSRGKFYQFSRKPLAYFPDQYPNKWTDGTKLTDGVFQKGADLVKGQYVGWQGLDPVEVVVDLGRPQTVEEVQVFTIGNMESYFVWPSTVKVEVRGRGEDAWRLWSEIEVKERPGSSDHRKVISLRGDPVSASEVKVTLVPDVEHKNGTMLISEIDIVGEIKNSWKMVPAEGVYHGAFPPAYGFDKSMREGLEGPMRVDVYEKLVGKPLSMVLWYQGMAPGRDFDEIQAYRMKEMTEDFYGHRMMVFGWLPMQVSLEDIASGKLDDYFEKYFRDSVDSVQLMGIDDPVWFRPMNEFNGNWVPYGLDPENFLRAWWRIYNIAEKVGAAQKHIFVWAPNHRSYPNEPWNAMEAYYPGDQYVDWVGLSCYPPSRRFIKSEDDLYPIERMREVYEKYGHYKPIMIAEGGFADHIDKVRWVDEWFGMQEIYPNLRAYIWENHYDRVIQGDEEALNLYREKVRDPSWIERTWVGN